MIIAYVYLMSVEIVQDGETVIIPYGGGGVGAIGVDALVLPSSVESLALLPPPSVKVNRCFIVRPWLTGDVATESRCPDPRARGDLQGRW